MSGIKKIQVIKGIKRRKIPASAWTSPSCFSRDYPICLCHPFIRKICFVLLMPRYMLCVTVRFSKPFRRLKKYIAFVSTPSTTPDECRVKQVRISEHWFCQNHFLIDVLIKKCRLFDIKL